jgi:hypothetical protein
MQFEWCFLFEKIFQYDIKLKTVLSVLYFKLFVNIFILKNRHQTTKKKKALTIEAKNLKITDKTNCVP